MGLGLDLVHRFALTRRWFALARSQGLGRRGHRLVAAVALAAGILGTTNASALATPTPSASSGSTTAVDRGEVTVAVAAVGALHPSQQRQLGFGVSGTVTEVPVKPGDTVTAGQILAELDDGPASSAVSSAEDALSEADDALTEARQPPPATAPTCAAGTGAGTGAGGGTGTGGGAAGGGPAMTRAVSLGPTAGTSSPGTPSASASASPEPTRSPSAGPSGTPAPPTASAPPTGVPSRSPGPVPTARPGRTPGGAGRPTGGCGGSGSRAGGGGGSAGAAGQSNAGDPILRAQQQVTSAELRLAQARDQLAGATITAPVAGKVLAVAGQVGAQVTAGSGFIQLGVVNDMQVAASFPEADAGRLRTGLTASVTLADRPGEEFPAKVIQVDPMGVSDGRLVRFGALLAFDHVPAGLLVGQSAQVRVAVVRVDDVLRLPSTAVHTGPDGAGSVRLAGSAEPRQVVIGVRGDRYTEIRSGLAESDRVLTSW